MLSPSVTLKQQKFFFKNDSAAFTDLYVKNLGFYDWGNEESQSITRGKAESAV